MILKMCEGYTVFQNYLRMHVSKSKVLKHNSVILTNT